MQQIPPYRATTDATPVQRLSLKALAHKALACNNPCNGPATVPPESVQQTCNKTLPKCCTDVAPLQARLLDLARSTGVPDYIVTEMPTTELQAVRDQLPLWDTAELRRQVLTWYLHELARCGYPSTAKPKPNRDPRQPGEFGDWREGLTTDELHRIRGATP